MKVVGDFHITILVQVVATSFENIQALFGQVAVLARMTARRDDLHVGVDSLHARIHLLVDQVLEDALPGHFPGHFSRPDNLLALGVSFRSGLRVVQHVLIERIVFGAVNPDRGFSPGHGQ